MSNVSRDKSVAKNAFGQLVTRLCTIWKFPDSKEMRLRLNDNNIVCDMCGKDNRKIIFSFTTSCGKFWNFHADINVCKSCFDNAVLKESDLLKKEPSEEDDGA